MNSSNESSIRTSPRRGKRINQPKQEEHEMNDRYAVLVGLDWADMKHDLCWKEPGKRQVHTQQIEQSPEKIGDWVAGLMERFPGCRYAVCLARLSPFAAEKAFFELKIPFCPMFAGVRFSKWPVGQTLPVDGYFSCAKIAPCI